VSTEEVLKQVWPEVTVTSDSDTPGRQLTRQSPKDVRAGSSPTGTSNGLLELRPAGTSIEFTAQHVVEIWFLDQHETIGVKFEC
jgi:hypothetical protein